MCGLAYGYHRSPPTLQGWIGPINYLLFVINFYLFANCYIRSILLCYKKRLPPWSPAVPTHCKLGGNIDENTKVLAECKGTLATTQKLLGEMGLYKAHYATSAVQGKNYPGCLLRELVEKGKVWGFLS